MGVPTCQGAIGAEFAVHAVTLASSITQLHRRESVLDFFMPFSFPLLPASVKIKKHPINPSARLATESARWRA